MLDIILTLPDVAFNATFSPRLNLWVGEAQCSKTARRHSFTMTTAEISAVVYLSMGGDDAADNLGMYALAEPAIANFPPECRPFGEDS